MNDTIVAGLVGGAVAVILKIFDTFVSNSKNSLDDTTAFRHDLMARIDQLTKEIESSKKETEAVKKEADDWQAKYLAEREIRLKQEWQLQMMDYINQDPAIRRPMPPIGGPGNPSPPPLPEGSGGPST